MQKAPIRQLADGAAMKRIKKLLLDSKKHELGFGGERNEWNLNQTERDAIKV